MAQDQENIKINFDTNASQAANDSNKLGNAIDDVSKSTKAQETAQKALKTQLREANMELQKAVQHYGETSAEATKAAKGVANLKDQIGFAKDLSASFNPDQKFKALGASTQIAATGVQGVTAGMALFGDQSKDTEKALLKVQSAMAFSDAISNLSNLGDQWKLLKATVQQSTLVTKANTAANGLAAIATKLFGAAVDTTSVSFKFLKGAIAATGIGLLVVGVVALIQNFDKIKEVAYNLVPGLKEIGNAIGDIYNAVTDFLGVTSEAERALDKQKAFSEKAIKQNEKFLERNASTLTDAQKKEIQLRNEHFDRVKEGRFSNAESVKIYHEAQQKEAKEANDKLLKEQDEAQDKIDKKAKEARDKANEDAKEAQNKKKELIKEGLDKEQELLKFNQDLNDKTDEEKLARQKERSLEEIRLLEDKGVNVEGITRLNEEKFLTLEKELAEKRSAEQQLAFDADLEALIANKDATNEMRLEAIQTEQALLQEQYDNKILSEEDFNSKQEFLASARIELKNKEEEEKLNIEKAAAQQKKDIQDGVFGLADKAVGLAGQLAGKNKAIQKAAMIAEGALSIGKQVSAINTANVAALATPQAVLSLGASAVPVIAMNTIAGGIGIASTVAATAKALSALGGGGSISAGAVPSGGGSAPTIAQQQPQVAFNNTAENQIGQSINKAQSDNPPIKVFVSEKDITKAQNNVKELVVTNSF